MARPNRIPISRIGRKEITGIPRSRFTIWVRCPSLNTSLVAPKAAPTDSRKPRVAFTGTHTDRNTAASSTSDNPTTSIPNGSSAPTRRELTSICMAVMPVTAVSTP